MRVNTTVVIELPTDLDRMIVEILRVTEALDNRKISHATARESSQRDQTPATISFTISGEVAEKEL